jgi:hypothetical protein
VDVGYAKKFEAEGHNTLVTFMRVVPEFTMIDIEAFGGYGGDGSAGGAGGMGGRGGSGGTGGQGAKGCVSKSQAGSQVNNLPDSVNNSDGLRVFLYLQLGLIQ